MFRYLPEQASDFAHRVDAVNNFITDVSVFFTVAIVGAMIYFAVKYRKKNGVDHETPRIEGDHTLEIIWTVVPTIICVIVGVAGWQVFHEMRNPPANALEINVTGQKWKWDFEYSNGKKSTTDFVVPVDEPVKLILTSRDVLHSFFIPSMRVKSDAIPKRYTFVWFRPIKTGDYHVFCTEYCGTEHSSMLANLKVVSRAEYERWVNDDSEAAALLRMAPSEVGQQLYTAKGCNACHSLDGAVRTGPTFLKVFGREGKLKGGVSYKVDENYIRESILNPLAKVVEGYAPAMPSFDGQLTEAQIGHIIAFLKTVDGSTPAPKAATAPVVAAAAEDLSKLSPEERGKRIYQDPTKMCATCHTIDGSKLVGP